MNNAPRHSGQRFQPRAITYPAIVLFVIITIIPLLIMVWRSFTEGGEFTLEHYSEVLSSSRQLLLFGRTVFIALAATALSFVLGLPFSLAAARTDVPLGRKLAGLAIAAILIPPYFHAVAWNYLLSSNRNISDRLLHLLPVDSPMDLLCSTPGVIVVLGLAYLPYMILLTMVGFDSLDRHLEEASQQSRGHRATLFRITLPLAMPHMMCAAVFIFIFAVSNYGVGSLLSVNTYPVEVFIQFSTFFKEGRATATAVPVICLAILLLLFQYRLMHGRPYVSFSSAASSPMTLRLGPLRWVVFLGMVAILLFSVLLPVFALVIESGGIAAYRIALATSWRPIVESVALAAAVATVTVCIAFPIAYGLERHRGSLNELMRLIIFIPFAVPGTVYGIGLIRLWNRPGLDVVYSSWAILVIAMLARFCSFAVLILVSSIQQVDIQLDEAACMADVPWHRRLWQILLPINRPGLLIAWFVIFVLTVGELGTTLLVAPPGHEMLSVKIYSLMHYGANELVAALCVILILIGLILLGLINLLLKRQRGNGR